nr:putative integron gene cassette protein [uncultured bacterium]
MLLIVRLARLDFARVTCVGFGDGDWLSASVLAPDAVTSETNGDSSRGALRRPGFGFRQVCWGLVYIGIPRA